MRRSGLTQLFPRDLNPWTLAVLMHPYTTGAIPIGPIEQQVDSLVRHRLAAKALDFLRATGATADRASIARLREGAFRWMELTERAHVGAERALVLLSKAGIDSVVVKGPGIASCYESARWRPYSDVDLLVDPRDFPRALQVLADAGWAAPEKDQPPRPYFVRWCYEGTNLSRDGWDRVDLHHHVPPWLWGGRLDFRSVFERSREVTVGQRTFRCAAPEDNLLIAALHVVSDHSAPGRTLMIWQDLVQLAHSVAPSAAAARSVETGLAGWLRDVLAALPPEADVDRLVERLPAMPVAHRRRLAALLDTARTERHPTQEWIARLPLPSALVFVGGVVAPTRSYLDNAGAGGYRTWWADLIRPHRAGS